ncbi:MAG: hypothetical protein ACF8R9_01445 [Phycisphaerales bacterium JB054]
MRTLIPAAAGSLMVVSAAAHALDVSIYSQPTTANPDNVGLGWYSQSEPRVRKNYKHADDFTLAADAEVSRVVWWGQSSKHRHDDLTNFDTFQIEFFEATDVGGDLLPGALLAVEVFDIADTSPTETGRLAPNGAKEYRHEATLTAPFAAVEGRQYFIAVSAGMIETNSASDAWQWQDADLLNGWSATYSWASSEWTGYQDSDSAFELYAVPAPASVGPLAVWLLAGRRRLR